MDTRTAGRPTITQASAAIAEHITGTRLDGSVQEYHPDQVRRTKQVAADLEAALDAAVARATMLAYLADPRPLGARVAELLERLARRLR
jgi:hypothetical protein